MNLGKLVSWKLLSHEIFIDIIRLNTKSFRISELLNSDASKNIWLIILQ